MENLLLGMKVILMALSFMGLCGLVKRRVGIDGTVAPLVAASGVIVLLMLAGMLHVLQWAWWGLFAGGLAGFAWCYMIRHEKVNWLAMAVLGLFLIYGCWHFRDAFFSGNDTISHWAMVEKYLHKTHRFPDDSTQLIYFQSYPLGASVFIYYLTYLVGPEESAYIVAQMMLNVIAFLPVFGLIRRNRIFGVALSMGALVFLLTFNVAMTSLQVDSLLAFITIGATAAILQCWHSPKKAMFAALPVMMALVSVKSSGIFFSLLIAVMLIASARVNRSAMGGHAVLKIALLSILAIVAMFAAWELHVSTAYVNATTSKHAVSLEYYAQTMADKSTAFIRQVGANMLKRLLHPSRINVYLLGLAVLSLAFCLAAMARRREERKVWLLRLRNTVIAGVAIYIIWYIMLFCMYVFSMPADEAQNLASITRYVRTIIGYLIGLVNIFMLAYFCREDFVFDKVDKGAALGMAAAVAAFLLLGDGGLRSGAIYRMLRTPNSKPLAYRPILEIEEKYEVDPEKSYMVFTMNNVYPLHIALYTSKYEFFSNDIMVIAGGIEKDGYDPEAYYTFKDTYAHYTECEQTEDLTETLEQYMDQYDYLLICCEDSVFEAELEAFLKSYTGDTPVLYGY